ncbi:hypothetical protein [Hahella sp. CCB-MM4]|uniref:hypothetical protein n=1 Tax=Hahella sp. (strain CCB-MM4) TaxID=1926491 RepID=UPI00113FD0C5|nr:hypothetical protein [Hahella sp. CCB-MM4]
MENYPFIFMGHGVGNLSDDFEAHILFTKKPSAQAMAAIQKQLQGYGEINWGANRASFLLSDRELKGALKCDPTYTDNPEMVNDPKIYETFGLTQDKLKETQQRLTHFYYDFQHTLQDIHKDQPVSLCVTKQGPKVKLTPWHDWSEQQLHRAFDMLLKYFDREDVVSKRFKEYSEGSYYDSNAIILCTLLGTVVRKISDVKKLSAEDIEKLVEVIKSAVGYSDCADNFLLGAALYLNGTEMDEIVKDYPEEAMAALEEINEEFPLDEAFEDLI